MNWRAPIAAIALLGAATAAAAEEQPICADRPGNSTPTCTAPAGHFQLESGLVDWSVQETGGERDTSLVLGETVVRYGLTDHSEFQVDVIPWDRETRRAGGVRETASGFGDVVLIYKHRVTAAAAPFQIALYPYVKVPTAKHALGNGKWEGGLLLPVDGTIGNSPFSINLTPELDWAADGDGHGHHLAMAQVASLGWQVTDRFNLSGDVWAQWDWDPAGTTHQYSADGSVAYLVNDDFQLDAGANFGLNRNTPDVEIYAGVSKRF